MLVMMTADLAKPEAVPKITFKTLRPYENWAKQLEGLAQG